MKPDARTADRRAALGTLPTSCSISPRSRGEAWPATGSSHAGRARGVHSAVRGPARVFLRVKIEVYSGKRSSMSANCGRRLGHGADADHHQTGNGDPGGLSLARQGDQWRAYDVLIEGVSLVANYRAQFNAVIQRTSYPTGEDAPGQAGRGGQQAIRGRPAATRPVAPTPVQTSAACSRLRGPPQRLAARDGLSSRASAAMPSKWRSAGVSLNATVRVITLETIPRIAK